MIPSLHLLGLTIIVAGAEPEPRPSRLTDAQSATIDAITEAGPFGASAEVLRRLPIPSDTQQMQAWVASSHTRWSADGRSTTRFWLVATIGTQKAAAFLGNFERTFVPPVEATPVVQARVVCPDTPDGPPATMTGEISPLVDQFADTVARQRYHGSYPALAAGCVLESLITTETIAPVIPKPMTTRSYVAWTRAVDHRVTWEAPPGVALSIERQDASGVTTPVTVTTREGGQQVFTHSTRQKVWGVEPPSDNITYHARVGKGTWEEVGAVCGTRLKDGATSKLPRDALPWPKTRGLSRLQQVRLVVDEMRKVMRISDFDLEDVAYTPAPAEVVWKRKAGSTIELARLLVAVLARQKIPAQIGFVAGEPAFEVAPRGAPSVEGLTRPFVFVPARGTEPELWIDMALLEMPAGSLPLSELEGFEVVLCDATNPSLKPLPTARDAVSTFHVARSGTLAPLGQTALDVEIRYDGPIADVVRANARRKDNAAKSFPGIIARGFGGEYETVTLDDPGAGPLTAKGRIVRGDAGVGVDTIEMPAIGFDPFDFIPLSLGSGPAAETGPVTLYGAHLATTRTELRVPRGFDVKSGLEPETLRFGPATWKRTVTFTPATGAELALLTIESSLDFGPAHWSATDVETFRKAIDAYNKIPYPRLELHHKAYEALSAGNAKDGARLFQALLATHPNDPDTLSRLGMAWGERGIYALAMPPIARALEVAPAHGLALLAKAGLLGDGPTGGNNGETRDRPATIAAWRAVMDVAPGYASVELLLSEQLVAAQEPWYQPTANELEEGLGRLRTLSRIHGIQEAFFPYFHALWQTGDFKTIIAESGVLIAPPSRYELAEREPNARQTIATLPSDARTLAFGAALLVEGQPGLKKAVDYAKQAGVPQDELAVSAAASAVSLMVSGHWKPFAAAMLAKASMKGESAEDKALTAKLVTSAPHPDARRFPTIDRQNPRSVTKAYILAQMGTYTLTLGRAREVLNSLVHGAHRSTITDIMGVERVLMMRSLGPLALMMQHLTTTLLSPLDTAHLEELPGVAVKLDAMFDNRAASAYLAWDETITPPGWSVIPAGIAHKPSGLYREAFRQARLGQWPAARRWYAWAEAERLEGKADPNAIPDNATLMKLSAFRGLLESQPGDGIFEHALANEMAADEETRTAIAWRLLDDKRPDEALAVLAHGKSDSDEALEAEQTAELLRRDPAAARTWVEAQFTTGRKAVALAESLAKRTAHFGADAWLIAQIESRLGGDDDRVANNLAWMYLLAGQSGERAVRLARKAVAAAREPHEKLMRKGNEFWTEALKQHGYHPSMPLRTALHTLVCLLIDVGQLDEAITLIAEMLPRYREPSPHDQFVFARIADETGYTDDAERMYREVIASKDSGSTADLAARYLEKLRQRKADGAR